MIDFAPPPFDPEIFWWLALLLILALIAKL